MSEVQCVLLFPDLVTLPCCLLNSSSGQRFGWRAAILGHCAERPLIQGLAGRYPYRNVQVQCVAYCPGRYPVNRDRKVPMSKLKEEINGNLAFNN